MNTLPHLLLVEDHAVTRELIAVMLDDTVEVTGVASAESALAVAEETAFDAFIVDIHLGPSGGSGFDVLNALRQHPTYKQAPVIACTAFAMAGDREQFLSAGFDAYLAKPFTRAALRHVVREQVYPSGARASQRAR